MKVHRSWAGLAERDRGASVAIGNFDGVHLGHRAVIDLARRSDEPLGVVTFEPHPREYFMPQSVPFRLMNPEARAHRLRKIGVDQLYELPFDATMAAFAPEAFVTEVLVNGLGVSHVVVGADFCFGTGRAGTADDLVDLGHRHGFGVTVADLIAAGGREVSSTAIRHALSEGRPRDAASMLGHWHRIEGPVEHGEKRGRELGYPTANMSLARLHLPRLGVYAVTADVLDGPHEGTYGGAASLGVRPMFGVNAPNLESFLFDFTGDLYGAHVSVGLVEFLRPELSFDDVPALIDQMARDCDAARDVLAELQD